MGTLKTDQVWPPGSPSLAHHRLQTGNRSPLESPPAAKKLLKTGSKLEFASAPVQKTSAGKENRSILKPQRLAAVMGGTNELGGASVGGARTRSWPGSLRRVNFEHNVDVVVYDPVHGDYVCSESQQLVTEPRDRKLFIGRTLLGRGVRASLAVSTVGQRQPLDRLHTPPSQTSSRTEPALMMRRPLPPGPPAAVLTSPSGTLDRQLPSDQPLQQDLDFKFFEDQNGRLRLKFTVPLGPGVAAGDALVKANVAGNKIRVLGARTVSDSGAPSGRRHEFSWRYSLPMDVDPYAISARMDSSGNLFVEAPVKINDRRRTVGVIEQIGKIAAV